MINTENVPAGQSSPTYVDSRYTRLIGRYDTRRCRRRKNFDRIMSAGLCSTPHLRKSPHRACRSTPIPRCADEQSCAPSGLTRCPQTPPRQPANLSRPLFDFTLSRTLRITQDVRSSQVPRVHQDGALILRWLRSAANQPAGCGDRGCRCIPGNARLDCVITRALPSCRRSSVFYSERELFTVVRVHRRLLSAGGSEHIFSRHCRRNLRCTLLL